MPRSNKNYKTYRHMNNRQLVNNTLINFSNLFTNFLGTIGRRKVVVKGANLKKRSVKGANLERRSKVYAN